MRKRLQVLVDEVELEEIRAAAEESRMTVSEWVRQALRRARRPQPAERVEAKLAAIRRAEEFSYPSGEIEQMLAEIAEGRGVSGRE